MIVKQEMQGLQNGLKESVNKMRHQKIILISIVIFMVANGCINTKINFPPDINIGKNQLIYKNDRMQIWANDNRGYHHNYSPNDSSEYKFVTDHIGSNLNSVFLGFCNYHNISEIVSVGPDLIRILSSNQSLAKRRSDPAIQQSGNSTENIFGGNSGVSIIRNTGVSTGKTAPSTQARSKGDTKN